MSKDGQFYHLDDHDNDCVKDDDDDGDEGDDDDDEKTGQCGDPKDVEGWSVISFFTNLLLLVSFIIISWFLPIYDQLIMVVMV